MIIETPNPPTGHTPPPTVTEYTLLLADEVAVGSTCVLSGALIAGCESAYGSAGAYEHIHKPISEHHTVAYRYYAVNYVRYGSRGLHEGTVSDLLR